VQRLLRNANWSGVILTGAVNMITQCEVAILIDAIKKQSGLDIPSDAAFAALYAVANYNYRLIPQKPEPHKYTRADAGGSDPTPSAAAKITGGRRGRPKIIRFPRPGSGCERQRKVATAAFQRHEISRSSP
jgi:hypothetical protein